MADLYLSLTVMLLLCAAAGVLGTQVVRRTARTMQVGIQLLAGAGLILYMTCLWDRPQLTRWVPSSGAIILGNWLPVLACFFTGICVRTPTIRLRRRLVMAVSVCALAGYSLGRPLLGEPPRCIALRPGMALQVQTSEGTCSAAAAASLLRLHGIAATEGEMARLCLTRSGTHWLGVYRGLKLKVAGTGWDVVAEEFDPLSDSLMCEFRPGVLSLAFSSRSGSQTLAAGFSGQAGHSVVMLETTCDGGLEVFDPSPEFGFESWDRDFLKDIHSAILLRLVPRDETTLSTAEVRRKVSRERLSRRLANL